ncbi:MAG: signal peptide peptidase SppA [Desulfobacterales bacterium]|jgi:protease-4|nr:signal peptide peptidase SppA [Desulfobacterales bacterium]
MNMRTCIVLILIAAAVALGGCAGPQIKLFSSQADPLQEFTLEGKGEHKVLVVPVRGVISDSPQEGLLRTRPSAVQETVSHLRKAERDPAVKAVVLQLDSPGGSVTGSDMLYHEIARFKERTGRKVVAVMMDVAASGGYYVALPADRILAHPTTVTGSVGVIFVRPKVAGLLEKIGAGVEVSKSGTLKDLGSPFRATTADEAAIFQEMTDRLARRFLDLVRTHRGLGPTELETVASARIFLADEAQALKLVDAVGYMPDALAAARGLAGLAEDARVVVYRRTEYPDDNVYNPVTSYEGSRPVALVETGLSGLIPALAPGFYYLWLPAAP